MKRKAKILRGSKNLNRKEVQGKSSVYFPLKKINKGEREFKILT